MLSVIMPAYNEGARIRTALLETARALEGTDYEVVVVDDGSTDGTGAAAFEVARANPRIRVIRRDANGGKGQAIRHGFSHTRGDLVVVLDADGDIPPPAIWTLHAAMAASGADVVVGSKRHPASEVRAPRIRRLASAAYRKMVDLLFDLPVKDTQTGVKLFRRQVLETVFPRMRIGRFAHDLELLVAAHRSGYRMTEAPVPVTLRTTKMPLARASLQVWLDTLRIYYWASFWYWLSPGWTTKLWMGLFALGIAATSFGLAAILSTASVPSALSPLVYYGLFQFVGRPLRNWILVAGGTALVALSLVYLNRHVMNAFARADRGDLAGLARHRGPAKGGARGNRRRTMQPLKDSIVEKLEQLPESALRQVLDFVEFISAKAAAQDEPLLTVAGILSGTALSAEQIERELYGDGPTEP